MVRLITCKKCTQQCKHFVWLQAHELIGINQCVFGCVVEFHNSMMESSSRFPMDSRGHFSQVGLNIYSEIQVAFLLMKIRKKLLFCSKVKLSFAGRVIVVNQVLLSSLLYIISCWSFSKIMYETITKINPELFAV